MQLGVRFRQWQAKAGAGVAAVECTSHLNERL